MRKKMYTSVFFAVQVISVAHIFAIPSFTEEVMPRSSWTSLQESLSFPGAPKLNALRNSASDWGEDEKVLDDFLQEGSSDKSQVEELDMLEQEDEFAAKSSPKEHSSWVQQFSHEESDLDGQLTIFQELVKRHMNHNQLMCTNPKLLEKSPAFVNANHETLEMAVESMREYAEHGDSGAEYSLGFAFSKGLGVSQDFDQAVMWYTKSAEQNYLPAALNLGLMYLQGEGVMRDTTEATKWFHQALHADMGSPTSTHALHILGTISQAQNKHAEAVLLFQKGADLGDHHAQFALGEAYSDGRGAERDLDKANYWFGLAAGQGSANAQTNMGVHYMLGKGVQKNPVIAAQWFNKAAEQGQRMAQLNLGMAYMHGSGVPKNVGTAARWFLTAAHQGVRQAQINMGILYRTGQGVQQDSNKAAYWGNKAKENLQKSAS